MKPARTKTLLSVLVACALPVLTARAKGVEPPAPDCSIEALNLGADAEFLASVRRYFPTESSRRLSCKVTAHETKTAGEVSLRFSVADILNDEAYRLDAKIVLIERLEGGGARSIGRFVLPPDPLDGESRFEPQLVERDGAVLLRLSPRHGAIYRLDGDRLIALAAFDWRHDLQLYPDKSRGGQALGIDLDRMEGRIALTPDRSYNAAAPLSAFDAQKIGLVRLAFKGDRLAVVAQEAIERRAGDYPFIDKVMAEDDEERRAAKALPQGVEPCHLGAWSNDPDPKGLNVRAQPNAKAAVLGVAPPPRRAKSEEGAFGDEPIASEFTIVGFRNGWFLIDDIAAPGVRYGIDYPRGLPQPYKGRGWVSANLVGAAAANRGMPPGRLYQAPYAEALYDELRDKDGSAFPAYQISRILACSGAWALIETNTGHRGWTRSVCSNQATNCS